MSENNIFQEIQEDLDRQRLEALWKRYGSWVLVGMFAIVLGTALWTAWHSWHSERDQIATTALADLLSFPKPDNARQIDALIDYANKNNGLYQSVSAQLHAAEIAAQQGQKERAVTIYDSIAHDVSNDYAFRQLADLRSVELQLATGSPDDLSMRLELTSKADSPWRFTALSYRGYLALRTGDRNKARDIFTSISQDAEAPETLSHRARDMANYLSE